MASYQLRYFAWVRERIGVAEERVESAAPTVRALIAELAARDAGSAHALGDLERLRAALDQELCDMDAPLAGVREIALFPPMTGG